MDWVQRGYWGEYCDKERDEFLQGLIEEVKRKETSSEIQVILKKWRIRQLWLESLLALQKSDPELFTDVVVKGTAIQTIDFHLFLGFGSYKLPTYFQQLFSKKKIAYILIITKYY